jgi:hypothetical protein
MTGHRALAAILHDTYGCRVTCRGGRLADDRHPSHTEAYLDTAARILAALDAAGWTLVNEETLAEALHHHWHTDAVWESSISREEDMANHRRNAAGILAVLRGFRHE